MSEQTQTSFQAVTHRAVSGAEHDPSRSLFHGSCAICVEPWPCEAEKELQAARLAAIQVSVQQSEEDTQDDDFRVDAVRLPNCHAQGTLFWNNLVGASNDYASDDLLDKCVCAHPDDNSCLYCRLWDVRNSGFLVGVEWLLARWSKFTLSDEFMDAAEEAFKIAGNWPKRPTTREQLKAAFGAALAKRDPSATAQALRNTPEEELMSELAKRLAERKQFLIIGCSECKQPIGHGPNCSMVA